MKKIFLLLVAMVAVSGMCLAQSGSCGTNLTWTYDSGTLTISGSGDMTEYTVSSDQPWENYRSEITTVVLPDGITGIGSYAFIGCINLATINLPNSIETIRMKAFYGCTGLTSVTIPSGVTNIFVNAFQNCLGLASVDIPASVTKIGNNAFQNCSALTDVTVHWTDLLGVTTAANAFSDVIVAIVNLHVPCGTKSAYEATEPWSGFNIDDPCPSGQCGDNLYWLYNSDTHVLTITGYGDMDFSGGTAPWRSYNGNIQSISLPNGLTSIENYAFEFCHTHEFTSITIPATVTSIGESAFWQCVNLTSVNLPSGLKTIGNSAFGSCHLTAISIPSSVTTIGENAFTSSSGLTSITVEAGNAYYDSRDACNAIIETASNRLILGCKNTVIPNGVTSIGNSAFYGCSSLTSITIPESVTSIGNSAFDGCSSLTSITIPANVTTIGNSAFQGAGLTTITFDTGSALETIGESAFKSCMGLTSITIPNGVTSIGSEAFYHCDGLPSVTIPGSVTSIGDGAFFCHHLTDVYLYCLTTPPTLGETVFFNLTTHIHVPIGTLSAYSAYPWSMFTNKTDDIPYGKCGEDLYWELNTSTGVLTITGSGNMDDYAGYDSKPWHAWRNDITSVVLEDGVTSIGNRAFYGCSALASINIPDGLLSIGESAFNSCKALPSIDIPSSVQTIGVYAFANCWGLTSIVIPSGVTAIGANTFNGCKALNSIDIPSSVTGIGNQAFLNCSALTSIEIPSSVTGIGNLAFKGTGLKDVTVNWTSTFPTVESNAFDELDLSGINLHVPDGTYATYAVTAPWYTFNIIDPYGGKCGDALFWEYDPSTTTLTITGTGDMYDYTLNIDVPWFAYQTAIESVSLPVGLTNIGVRAFMDCTALTSVTIPAGVTSIKERAFSGCSGLTSITIPAGVTSIGARSFHNCSKMENITFADGSALQTIGNMAFVGTGLTFINIPAGVISIGNTTFSSCPSLTSITIPASVNSIDMLAFAYCPALENVYVEWTDLSGVTTDANAFSGVTLANVNLHLPFAAWESYEATAPWSGFKQVPVVTAKADPENDGVYYNTFYHGGVAYALPTGVEAYTAQRDGTDLILTKIAQAGDVLPADAAVILKSSVQQFEMTPSEKTPVTVGENDLLGKDASETAPSNCYVLSGPNPSNPDITEVGFYLFSGTLGAHKAYLVMPSSNPAPPRHLRFVFDSAMDIEQPTSDSSLKGGEKILLDGVLYIERGEHLYNAQGVRVK